ncbi:SAM-dependent methyltransferase [Alphaproteobacteria bacterium]|nr:SAM-dependent methyltransferase [Alphaproteobacteria bacterium]
MFRAKLLEEIIRHRIRHNGPIPVSDYMALALAHPSHGYYRKADPLGRDGDFITAPEISQAFGEIIGLWCIVTWQKAGKPTPCHLIEMGPGRGTLMADAMRAARAQPDFLDAAKIHLVETSPVLRATQRETLKHHGVTWHSALETVPEGPCIIIANEFFDALPINQYVRANDGWRGRSVGIDQASGQLDFVVEPAPVASTGLIPPVLMDAPNGSIFEHCPTAIKIASAIGKRLASDGIAALIIDYGYEGPDAGETLQAVRNHDRYDVLSDPGNADLTAHVDFNTVLTAAQAAGATGFGPIPQGAFLTMLGIEARTRSLEKNADKVQADLLRTGFKRLVGPKAMGALFKVLALTNGRHGDPAGFESNSATPKRTEFD